MQVSKLVSALRRGDHEEKLLMLRLDATDERLLQVRQTDTRHVLKRHTGLSLIRCKGSGGHCGYG